MTTRPSIEGITINVQGVGNKTVPKDVMAIFFTDEGVNDILAPFYETYNPIWQYTDAEASFGKDIASKIFLGQPSIPLTSNVVKEIWITPGSNGECVAYITKTPPCVIGGDR
jgi:hypothetical protein